MKKIRNLICKLIGHTWKSKGQTWACARCKIKPITIQKAPKKGKISIKKIERAVKSLEKDKVNILAGSESVSSLNTRYITVKNWNNYHTWPNEAGLRHLIFYKKENGFHKVVKKVGKRVLIDETEFFKWMQNKDT